ncbi:coiled-coil domain-containing protein 27 [Phyllostomus discolor]|uniref:Coiled-coil domain-containing protein 27 n=1 Tax=Phyllostomus discolor TaxID=89673 RepID=A0A7E6DP91_9CHIR|nr:coiled-coil domain-containing protein 27 [Phyllostomus discolor]
MDSHRAWPLRVLEPGPSVGLAASSRSAGRGDRPWPWAHATRPWPSRSLRPSAQSEASQGACLDRSFSSEVEDLRRMFLRRPDCPQFCSRATSMSSYVRAAPEGPPRKRPASIVALPGVVCLSPEAWKMPKDSPSSQKGLDSTADESLLPVSKSACEFGYLRKQSMSPTRSPATSGLVLGQSHLRKRVPWYISVIHEKVPPTPALAPQLRALREGLPCAVCSSWPGAAVLGGAGGWGRGRGGCVAHGLPPFPAQDHCLSVLGAEVQRLSELEEQVRRKDEEILALQGEREALRKQLRDLRRSKVSEAPSGQAMKERPSEPLTKLSERLSFLQTCIRDEEELRHWRQMQEEYVMEHRTRDLEALGEEEQGREGEPERLPEEGAEKERVELELDEEQEAEGRAGSRRRACFPEDDFEEELMAQLQEYEQVIQEFQFELEVARTRLSLATGACISLQRQVDHQEAQLQKASMENQLLQKELRERKQQLQAMTDKFSNLREEKKWEEVKGLGEKDNLALRQRVWELEQELASRDGALAELDARVGRLQAQAAQSQKQQQGWQQLQEATRDRMEAAQQAEQQTRVALESAQSRLERLRNKIIQAAFGALGTKSLTTEISDNDILEALQKLVLERAEYYSQLKQRGFKGPGPPQSELTSQGKSKKLASSK